MAGTDCPNCNQQTLTQSPTRALAVSIQLQESTNNLLKGYGKSSSQYDTTQDLTQSTLALPAAEYWDGGPADVLVVVTDNPVVLEYALIGAPKGYTQTIVVNASTVFDSPVANFRLINNGPETANVIVTAGVAVPGSIPPPFQTRVTDVNGITGSVKLLAGDGIDIDSTTAPITISTKGVVKTTDLSASNGASLVGWDNGNIAQYFTYSVAKRVSSIDELRQLDPTKYTQVFRTGYSQAGDKGHMAFVYVPTPTPPADNNGTYVSAKGGQGYWLGLVTGVLDAEAFGWPGRREAALNDAIKAAVQMNIGVVRISTPGQVAAPVVFPENFGVVIEGCNQESLITVADGVAIDAVFTTPDFETVYFNQPQTTIMGGVSRDCGLRNIAINCNKANVPPVTNWMKGMALRCIWLRPIIENVAVWNVPGIGGISVYPSAGITPPGYNFPKNLMVDTKIRTIRDFYIHDTEFEGFIWEGPSDTRIENMFVGWPAGSLNTGNYDPTKKSLKFTSGGLVSVSVENGGQGYDLTTTLTIADPTAGVQAVVEPIIVNGVLGAKLVSGGQNYPDSTRVYAIDRTTDKAYGAVCKITNVGGVITDIQVTGGRWYTAATEFVVIDTTGQGSGASFTPVLTDGVFDDVLVLNEGYGLTNPTITINDPSGKGAGAVLTPNIDTTCDGLVFNNQGAELGFVHSFNNVNGWAVNFRSDNAGFPRITADFIMAESSLGDLRIGGHTRYQIGQLDVHTAGTGGGPAKFPAALISSDRGGIIGGATDYRRGNAPQGTQSFIVRGSNNQINSGTIFGRGQNGDGVLLYGSQNTVTNMSISGVTGAALTLASASVKSCRASINSADSLYAVNNKCPQVHSSTLLDVTATYTGLNQFVNIANVTGRQWQDWRIIGTDNRGIIVGNKDIRFGSADCTLTTVQNIVITHNCVRAPTVNDVLLQIKENFGAKMDLESISFVSATRPYYNPSNPVLVQGTITVAVKFRTAGTGTATIQVNIV
ncbi:hypothetical protein [Burkholderia phage BCSR5]|nr:hypothetical protein [Burkholderia phage BCSR5]